MALMPIQAQAHLSGVQIDDFWLGALHPLITLVDALAILALGMLAGQSGEVAGLRVAATFAAMMGAGATASLYNIEGPWVGWITTGSLLVLGGLVALSMQLPLLLLLALAMISGFAHGMSIGLEIEDPIKPWQFIPGVAVAGFFGTFYAMFMVVKLKPWWTKIGVRVIGSWIAAVGLLLVALDSLKPAAV